MKDYNKSLVQVHVAVLFFGLSGLFAKLVSLPGILICLGRVFFSAVFLFTLLKIRGKSIRLETKKDYVLMIVAGVVLAIHWTTFLTAIQVSTVAVGTLTFATFSLFVTFLEPYLFHEKLKMVHVGCAVVMMLGVMLIVPEFKLENSMTQGVVLGMIGSLSYAIVSLFNRSFSNRYIGTLVSFYEQTTAAVVLLPAFFVMKPRVTAQDWLGLIILGVVFTGVAHTMYISGLKRVRVQTASIIASLESVYGILAAFLVLGEVPGIRELAGGIVILGVVFYSTYCSVREENEKEKQRIQIHDAEVSNER